MNKTGAFITLYSYSEQRRTSAYHSGKPEDIISLLVAAGVDDPAFGEMIVTAALLIRDELKERKQQPAEA